jgi:hypothetical protein
MGSLLSKVRGDWLWVWFPAAVAALVSRTGILAFLIIGLRHGAQCAGFGLRNQSCSRSADVSRVSQSSPVRATLSRGLIFSLLSTRPARHDPNVLHGASHPVGV